MRRKAFLLLPFLAALLLSGCPRPLPYIPINQLPPLPGKESFARFVAAHVPPSGSTQQTQLLLRQFGMSPNEISVFEKQGSTDGRLDETELREAFDTGSYIDEERNHFWTKSPDTNGTLPADAMAGADQNGDKRITSDEWLLQSHRIWLQRLQSLSAPDPNYQRKAVILWKRPELALALDNLAPRLFNQIDNNVDRVVSDEELAAYAGINNERTFAATRQGRPDIIDPQGFARLMARSQATLVRNLNEYFLKLDKLQVDGMVSKNELAAAVAGDPQGVATFIQLPKETAGRLEFEKAVLKAAVDRPVVQKALVKWAWPESIPEP
jgi:hypothetical protein